MGGHPARDYWEGPGLALLIGSFLLAPFAWLLEMQVSYSLVKWACAADRRDVLLLMPAGSLALIGISTAMAWVCWTRRPKPSSTASPAPPPRPARRPWRC